jgi:hypothetical protein
MTSGSGQTSFRDRHDPRSTLYWLDIDVTFNDIFRQPRMISGDSIVPLPRSSLQYSVLHGVGTVANALSVGDRAKTFDHFAVDVAAFARSDEDFSPSDHQRSARMIWNELDVRSPRLQIHVQTKMLRHLVELYVTKRIDTVVISMKIAIERHRTIDANPIGSELLPVLDSDGRLYFRRTQCELLSVQASLLGSGSKGRRGATSRSAPRSASCRVHRPAFHAVDSAIRPGASRGLPRRAPERPAGRAASPR